MPTAEEIIATFAEFATPPSSQDLWLDLADKRTAAVAVWGNDADIRALAVALLAAHSMVRSGVVEGVGMNAGALSESIGSASVTYARPRIDTTTDDLSTTTYGRQLTQLREDFILSAHTSFA